MKKREAMGRLWWFLLFSILISATFYFLPEEILGFKLKKADLLSVIRQDSLYNSPSTNEKDDIQKEDSLKAVLLAKENLTKEENREALRRDSLYKVYLYETSHLDTLPESHKVLIKDFSPRHNALQHTFDALDEGKPLRIAFLGDSFIEGDIFTYDIRQILQTKYGGSGVGWMPITSKVAGFRKGIQHQFKGWNTQSIMQHSRGRYYFGEIFYTPQSESEATVSYQMVGAKSHLTTAEIFYRGSEETLFTYSVGNGIIDTAYLAPCSDITSYKVSFSGRGISFSFPRATENVFYGVSLEGIPTLGGVSVDNFSLRGSSGITLTHLDPAIAKKMNTLRHYQLIVLQYGMNILQQGRYNYSKYTETMKSVLQTLRSLFPESDILLMGVSDRATNLSNGTKGTMPELYPLREALKKVAQEQGIAYWDTFEAMQTGGGIVQFVATGKAAKDYTHLSFSGGKYLAKKFTEAFFIEKKLYQVAKQ